MKRFSIFFAVLISLFLIGFGTLFFWWKSNSRPPSNSLEKVRIVIPRGSTAVQIGNQLYNERLIKSPLAFKFYVQLTGKSENLQAGEFELAKNLKLTDLVTSLFDEPLELWVTIPEGLRVEELSEKITKSLEMDTAAAIKFSDSFSIYNIKYEGYLFPDTYLFPRTVTATEVFDKMWYTFQSQTSELKSKLVDGKTKNGLDFEEVIVLASIIERETKTDEERPMVAGIYLNRLDLGMPLQADATVQYAVASARCLPLQTASNVAAKCKSWWPVLTRDNLEINSSYNTYKNTGLPPAPIASPGLSSIKAAFDPTDTDYLYYIHDSDGVIHYAKTLAEHNANIARYLGK